MKDDSRAVRGRFAELIAEGQLEEAMDYVADGLLELAKRKSDCLLTRFELTPAGQRS